MGTKRFLANPVASLIAELPGTGRVVDLFCGTGAVTAALQAVTSVLMNDKNAFLGPLLRTRFVVESRVAPYRIVNALQSAFEIHRKRLENHYIDRLINESKAIDAGRLALSEYMDTAPHVGSDHSFKEAAIAASDRDDHERYCLTTLYFSGGYVSSRQAIALDALRYAIDHNLENSTERDQSLAALTVTLDRVLNSPGHSAQFLRPNTEAGFRRICQVWTRDVWNTFLDSLADLIPLGEPGWRLRNEFRQGDATNLVQDLSSETIRAVYADPPYTKDQYSRYYHVHETLYLYDFPSSTGRGRYRNNRFSSPFSSALHVESAFRSLFGMTAGHGLPLVLSYPPDGLLYQRGIDMVELARDFFSNVSTTGFDATHSTLGASSGTSYNKKVENVYVCSI